MWRSGFCSIDDEQVGRFVVKEEVNNDEGIMALGANAGDDLICSSVRVVFAINKCWMEVTRASSADTKLENVNTLA